MVTLQTANTHTFYILMCDTVNSTYCIDGAVAYKRIFFGKRKNYAFGDR